MNKKVHDTCTVEGCDRKHRARGYCQSHYMQARRGVPIAVIKERVRNRFPQCAVPWCSKVEFANGFCELHHRRQERRTVVVAGERLGRSDGICRLCSEGVWAKGLCHGHYQIEQKWRPYGFGADDYEKKLRDQSYACALCSTPSGKLNLDGSIKNRLCVDHCHETMRIRGLLCDKCNRGLGLLQDDAELLRRAATYLDHHRVDDLV